MRHEPFIISADLHPVVRRLVEIRKGWEMPIPEIAKRCFLNPRSFYKYESGELEPSLKALERWAKILGYEIRLRAILPGK